VSATVPRFGRVAGTCGIAALFVSTVGWLTGGLAQPAAYSSAPGTVVAFCWIAFVGAWLLRESSRPTFGA
jgi:putative Mn2+ efflux pump MntP